MSLKTSSRLSRNFFYLNKRWLIVMSSCRLTSWRIQLERWMIIHCLQPCLISQKAGISLEIMLKTKLKSIALKIITPITVKILLILIMARLLYSLLRENVDSQGAISLVNSECFNFSGKTNICFIFLFVLWRREYDARDSSFI